MKRDSQCSDADPGHLTAEGRARQGKLTAKSRALAGALSLAKDAHCAPMVCASDPGCGSVNTTASNLLLLLELRQNKAGVSFVCLRWRLLETGGLEK